MAKGDFEIHDERDNLWLIRPGDPAFELVRRLPQALRKGAHLPAAAIRTGFVPEDARAQANQRLKRLAAYDQDDDVIASAVLRFASVHACLTALADTAPNPIK